jgi:hypothetical protein
MMLCLWLGSYDDRMWATVSIGVWFIRYHIGLGREYGPVGTCLEERDGWDMPLISALEHR